MAKRTAKAIVVNPRKRSKRRRSSARRVSNPKMSLNGLKAAIKGSAPTMAGGTVGGFMTGFADTKFLSDKPLISVLSKIALAVGGTALLRKHPNFAAGFAGGVMGGLGYSVGVKLGGGMVALTKADAMKGLGAMADEDDTDVLGDVVDESGMGDVVDEIAGNTDDDLGMGDIVDMADSDEAEMAEAN